MGCWGSDVYKRQVLDKTADNRCFVSLSGQRSYLESRGTDTSDMKDTDILKANTGSQVFLEAKLTFCDAMEDLSLIHISFFTSGCNVSTRVVLSSVERTP